MNSSIEDDRDDRFSKQQAEARVQLTREQEIDQYIDTHTVNGVRIFAGRIDKKKPYESIDGYEHRVAHEATMILHPKMAKEFLGVRISNAPDKPHVDQPCEWRRMMNQWLVKISRDRLGLSDAVANAVLVESKRLAAQASEMWGPKVPDEKPQEMIEVLDGMLKQLETIADESPARTSA